MVTRNKEKSWRRPWKRSRGFHERKPPTCKDPLGGSWENESSLCSQVPFSFRSLRMPEPYQEPERPGCPLISDTVHGAGRTRLDREAGGATRKQPVRKLPGEEGMGWAQRWGICAWGNRTIPNKG